MSLLPSLRSELPRVRSSVLRRLLAISPSVIGRKRLCVPWPFSTLPKMRLSLWTKISALHCSIKERRRSLGIRLKKSWVSRSTCCCLRASSKSTTDTSSSSPRPQENREFDQGVFERKRDAAERDPSPGEEQFADRFLAAQPSVRIHQ